MQTTKAGTPPLTQQEIGSALRRLGLATGQVVFVHSALSSLGYVAGGAHTLVDAFLEVLGPTGTLVAPTFTFSHQQADAPIFDPRQDRSEMGALSEAVRTHRAAQRSHHLLHSVAAVGAQAALITAVHGPSAWAADGPFWQFYAVDAKIVLLGVPYLRCTFFHMIEQMVATPYRHWVEKSATLRNEQGVECPLPTLIFRGKAGFIGNDFNKLGALLEEQQLVQVGPVGNAVTRVFAARAALAVGLAAYRRDPQLFLKTGPDYHPLADGYMVGEQYREKTVYR